jgi:hypothetical protein
VDNVTINRAWITWLACIGRANNDGTFRLGDAVHIVGWRCPVFGFISFGGCLAFGCVGFGGRVIQDAVPIVAVDDHRTSVGEVPTVFGSFYVLGLWKDGFLDVLNDGAFWLGDVLGVISSRKC